MKAIHKMHLAVVALALSMTAAPRTTHAADSQASKAKELTAAQTANTDAAKYDGIAEQSRQQVSASNAARTTTDGQVAAAGRTGKTATSSGAQPAVSDSATDAAAQYEKLAALAERLAANARKVADIHAKAAAALQAQAAVTAKLGR
jgi:hypothetical protein